MRTLFVTAEVFPLAKTGGLADVSAALPSALSDLGADIRIFVPAYPEALKQAPSLREIVRLGNILGYHDARILETVLPGSNVPVWLFDCPHLFNRDGGLYQTDAGSDWPDNALRFAAFNMAALAIADGAIGDWRPDLVHANDWHAGLLPLLLSDRKAPRPAALLTIHNLAYQGLFDAGDFQRIGMPKHLFSSMEYYGRISFLKAAILGADAINTVSPTYAAEILTPDYGCGLDGLLREKQNRISGILNGVDYGIWDPRSDALLPAKFSSRAMAGKGSCKQALQAELGLAVDESAPLLAFMSRLVHQKMPDIVLETLPALIDDGVQFALVAEGDRTYEEAFQRLAERYPGRVAARFGYEEPLAHRLLAGADMLAHPARFEPCGLVPIYALRYGTIPIVRHSGGMADSVVAATASVQPQSQATGFAFASPTAAEFLDCVRQALAFYRMPTAWQLIRANAMAQDFGWQRSADSYAALYRSLSGVPLVEPGAKVQPIKLSA